MDMQNSELFTIFTTTGRSGVSGKLKEEHPHIYTEYELDYHLTVLRELIAKEGITDSDGQSAMVQKHYKRAIFTLQVLMTVLGIKFHFSRIVATYRSNQTLEIILVLLLRCKKMFEAIDQMATIFKLLKMRKSIGKGDISQKID